jgi:PadR family transcriptional regulator, regulatory protein PadR
MRQQGDPASPILPVGKYVEGCLLLLIAERPGHGYELADRLAGLGLEKVDSATVYRVLRSLDRGGLVDSSWEEAESGPVRRRYRITRSGLMRLRAWVSAANASASDLASFVARHRQLEGSSVLSGQR